MEQSLLFRVIQSFDSKEKRNIDTFLHSDFFNKGKNAPKIEALWLYLTKKSNKKDYYLKDKVHNKIFNTESGKKGRLEKLMSNLLGLLYEYIILRDVGQEKQQISGQLILYKYFMNNGLNRDGAIKAKSLKQLIANQPVNIRNLESRLKIHQVISAFESLKNSRNDDLNLPHTLDHLDRYYIFSKLEMTIQLLSINLWIKPIQHLEAVKTMDAVLKANPDVVNSEPVFQLYLLAYQLLKGFKAGNVKLFEKFLIELEGKNKNCTPNQLKAFQALARNYCIHFYHKGDENFLHVAYKLYRKHLKEGLLYHQDKILTGTFCNLILLAIWNGELKWARNFAIQHKSNISGVDTTETVYQFNLATILFYENKNEQALTMLPKVFNDQYFKYAARRLEIMILYEQKSPLLDHRLEAYKLFVYRLKENVHSAVNKDRNNNFVHILKQIRHPKTYGNKSRSLKLLKKINSTTKLSERFWLKSLLA